MIHEAFNLLLNSIAVSQRLVHGVSEEDEKGWLKVSHWILKLGFNVARGDHVICSQDPSGNTTVGTSSSHILPLVGH